jgi:putative tryptophan/tyrosine transport system substrate-binding protein
MCSRWTLVRIIRGYGPNFAEMWKRVATHTDRVLKRARPSELPIERRSKVNLVINLRTAKAMATERC